MLYMVLFTLLPLALVKMQWVKVWAFKSGSTWIPILIASFVSCYQGTLGIMIPIS